MLLERISWVSSEVVPANRHVAQSQSSKKNYSEIYSVDIHPSGLKFAVSYGEPYIRLWSTKGLLTRPDEKTLSTSTDGKAGPPSNKQRPFTIPSMNRFGLNGDGKGNSDNIGKENHNQTSKSQVVDIDNEVAKLKKNNLISTLRGHTAGVQ